MDPTPERLVIQPPGLPPGSTCQSIAATPETAVKAAGLSAGLRVSSQQRGVQELHLEPGCAGPERVLSRAHHGHRRLPGLARSELHTHLSDRARSRSARATTSSTGTRHARHAGPGSKQFDQQRVAGRCHPVYALKARSGLPAGISRSRGRSAPSPTRASGSAAVTFAGRSSRASAPGLGYLCRTSRSAAAFVPSRARRASTSRRSASTRAHLEADHAAGPRRSSFRRSASSDPSSSATQRARLDAEHGRGRAVVIRASTGTVPRPAATSCRTARTTTATSRTTSRSRRSHPPQPRPARGETATRSSGSARRSRSTSAIRRVKPRRRRSSAMDSVVRRRRSLLTGGAAGLLLVACLGAEAASPPSE